VINLEDGRQTAALRSTIPEGNLCEQIKRESPPSSESLLQETAPSVMSQLVGLRDSLGSICTANEKSRGANADWVMNFGHNAALGLDGLQDFVQRCECHEMEKIWQK
jgi:hypothetical protein